MSLPVLEDNVVRNIDRCPQCGVTKPLLTLTGKPEIFSYNRVYAQWYFTVKCSKCGHLSLMFGWNTNAQNPNSSTVTETFPKLELISEALPDRSRRFLQQAVESRHAPDGALMLAASSIDSMLKEIGYKEGTLFRRIEQAAENGCLTSQMRDWAHEIRLSANEPRHADEDFDGATPKDADQVIQFAKALGEYLFILPARVQKWKDDSGNRQAITVTPRN